MRLGNTTWVLLLPSSSALEPRAAAAAALPEKIKNSFKEPSEGRRRAAAILPDTAKRGS